MVEVMRLVPFDMKIEMSPHLSKYGFEDLHDAPHLHRWRAGWSPGNNRNEVSGIYLQAYRVTKSTPCGAWIDVDSWRSGGDWQGSDWHKKRWVSNDGRQSWAKPTQEEAIKSIAIRLTRWSQNLARDMDRIISAADALAKLRTDLASYAKTAAQNIRYAANMPLSNEAK